LGWTLLGAPLDSSGAGRGEERGPEALRAAGLADRVGARDGGDVAAPLRPAQPDARTGILAVAALRNAASALERAVGEVLEAGDRPLVAGGDCSLLPCALAGARPRALWFVDGHADYWDGASSPTGEAADMDLAMVVGAGTVDAEGIVLLGHRPPESDEDVAAELGRMPAELARVSAPAIREAGPEETGREWAARLGGRGPAWVHLDLDVLDRETMPAVTYPQPYGLGWDELEALLSPLVRHPALIGLSVSDLEADLDPAGEYAARTVDLLAGTMT
jgi:arginase